MFKDKRIDGILDRLYRLETRTDAGKYVSREEFEKLSRRYKALTKFLGVDEQIAWMPLRMDGFYAYAKHEHAYACKCGSSNCKPSKKKGK